MEAKQSSSAAKTEEPPEKPKTREREIFQCYLCNLKENYDYFGRRPPFCKAVTFVEDSYIMKDPFSSSRDNNENFLLLGGKCALCSKSVCQECSVFFTRRICSACCQQNINVLPEELTKKMNKGNSN